MFHFTYCLSNMEVAGFLMAIGSSGMLYWCFLTGSICTKLLAEFYFIKEHHDYPVCMHIEQKYESNDSREQIKELKTERLISGK